jgi:MFS family permease
VNALAASRSPHLLILVVVIGFWLGQAVLAGRLADSKGRSLPVYLLAALLVGPLVLIIALLLRPPRSTRDGQDD